MILVITQVSKTSLFLVKNELNWHTYISFLAGDDFREHTAVITKPVGKKINEDKHGTPENEQSTSIKKNMLNDDAISSSNSMFCLFLSAWYSFFLAYISLFSIKQQLKHDATAMTNHLFYLPAILSC